MATRRSKNQARRHGGHPLPGWVWLLMGLLLGAVAFGFLFFREKWQNPSTPLPQPNPNAQASIAVEGDEPVVPEIPEKPKPKYDFYTLLPEKEVVIPDAELAAQARAEASSTNAGTNHDASFDHPVEVSSPTPDTARYLIQAGAFKNQNEAETLKAQIALTGEVARVETAEINGTTIYRVRMGPYANASGLAAAKQALASHGIAAQAIRVK